MVVDSCIDSQTQKPAALQYLEILGVNVAVALKLVVITHWHNDHMLGASRIFDAAQSSALWCSAALKTPEYAELVAASSTERLRDVDLPEFDQILQILKRRKADVRAPSVGPEWAIEGRVLYRRGSQSDLNAEVHALSPSSGTLTLAHREFAAYLPEYRHTKLTPVSLSPNNVAVVLWVQVGDKRVLLGSDLEQSRSPNIGWKAVVNSPIRPSDLGHMFKIPHHGSETAHNDDVWGSMLVPSPVAALTPFIRGHNPLPSEADISRIKTKTSRLYSTAIPGGWKPRRRDPAVERMLGRRIRSLTGGMGHVRVRWQSRKPEDPTVELFSGATRL